MRQTSEKLVKNIKRATRKQYSSEEKIRIVLATCKAAYYHVNSYVILEVNRMHKLLVSTAIATLFFGTLFAQTSTEQSKYVSVMLYPDTDHGTCNIGMQVNAGGAVLRAGPSVDFAVIATLEAGHVVSMCDGRDGWYGIIDGQDIDVWHEGTCSIGISVPTTQPYVGPCRSGWIEETVLTGIYG